MLSPVGNPWDPRAVLPPGQNGGINGTVVAWNTLQLVILEILPQAWHELVALI